MKKFLKLSLSLILEITSRLCMLFFYKLFLESIMDLFSVKNLNMFLFDIYNYYNY